MPDVIFIVGGKGGVGATHLAVETAKHFAQTRSTLLVDGDLAGRRSVAILFNSIARLDERRISEEFALVDLAPQLSLFELAGSIHGGFTVKSDDVEGLYKRVAPHVEMVIVDASQPFAAAVRPFAVRSSNFIVVVEPSMLGVTGARVMQHELSKFGVPPSRLNAVVLVREPRPKLATAEIERALGMPILGEIPVLDDKRRERAVLGFVNNVHASLVRSDELLTLQPSTSTPLGERRLGKRGAIEEPANALQSDQRQKAVSLERDARETVKAEVHREISRRIDVAALTGGDHLKIEELKAEIEGTIADLVGTRTDIGSAEEIARLRREIIDEVLGYGPLEELMADDSVSEIMVNGPDTIYVERRGVLERTKRRFNDSKQLRLIIERIITPLGRHIDEASPMVDARLPDGSRVNATVEPLSLDGPTLTIRRFAKERMNASDLIGKGSMTPAMADLLRAAVEARLNIVISGGTGSGKTTLLNVISNYIPDGERIVTIEDAAELQINREHVVRLEARPANAEGHGEIRIRDLVKNSLRMRPDRIVVGECRGGEALDMLQAMNTGHDGSLTTIHANTPRDCLSRIETMVMMAGYDLPIRAIREQVSGAVDLVVQTARMRDGSRKIVSISEVVGMESDVVTTQELVRFDQRGLGKDGAVAGAFVYTGVQPMFLPRLEEYGITFEVERLSEMQLAVAW